MTTTLGLLITTVCLSAPAQTSKSSDSALDYKAMDKLGWKLSCQGYTFGRNGATFFETLDILKGMGVKYVELSLDQKLSKELNVAAGPDMPAEAEAAMLARMKEAGIQATGCGMANFTKNEAEARKLFAWCKKLGMTNLIAEPDPKDRELWAMLDKLCGEYGVNVTVHNHPKPSTYWNPDTVLKAVEGCSRRIGACSDTGHWARSGLKPVECLKKLAGRTIQLHFKDLVKEGGWHDVPWGTGECDFKGMLAELKRQGFKGVFTIEYEHGSGEELKANVAKCVQAFSKAASELGADTGAK